MDYCPKCKAVIEYKHCEVCGGDGYYEEYSDAETTDPCESCEGKGIWLECPKCGFKVDDGEDPEATLEELDMVTEEI